MGKEKGENVKEERGGGAWRRGACCDRRRNTQLTKVHNGRASTKESKNMSSRWRSLSKSYYRACFCEPSCPSALTQAAGGALVVGEVAARWATRLAGGLSGRASSIVMTHDEAATYYWTHRRLLHRSARTANTVMMAASLVRGSENEDFELPHQPSPELQRGGL